MDLRECYARLGGDYEGIMGRLAKEERVKKFLNLFLKDTSYQDLCSALEVQDWENAFRAAHTMKGVSMNLAFDDLARAASELTEALRGGAPADDPTPLVEKVREQHQLTKETINQFMAENPA